MAEWWEWTGEPGPWQANEAPAMWAGGSPMFDESGGMRGGALPQDYYQSPEYQRFIGGGDPYGPGSSGDPNFTGEGSGGWLNAILGGIGSIGSFLGNNASWLGPLAAGAGSIAGGAMGANASNEAARLQAAALNRGIDLQTAQWLQQQANQAPWLQAGHQALPQLMQLAGQAPPAAFQGPPSISGAGYALPAIAPTWGPQAYRGPQRPGGGRLAPAGGAPIPSGGGAAPGGIGQTGNVDWSTVQLGQRGGDMNDLRIGGNMVQDAAGNWIRGEAMSPGVSETGNVDWSTVQLGQSGGDMNDMITHGGGSAMDLGAGGGDIWGVPNPEDYRYTPGQGPQAAAYRYTPGQTPDAAAYQSGPPQLYQGAMPGTQVPTLQGQDLLAQDPGYQFRQDQARKALEASSLAKGMGMSGSTLGALQSQSQDLASQEYGNAWQRMMARDTEQYGRDWGQYQQRWNQGVQGTQLGLQTQAQNFGQAMSAAQLREQVNQVASQQGWSQAQAEAAFREQMAQQAGAQNWQQALQGQQTAWQQGLTAQQWEQQQRQAYDQSVYDRMMQQSGVQYGRDVAQNQTDYERQLAAYNSQLQNQTTQWNRLAALSGVGQTSAEQLGKYGYANTNQIGDLLSKLGTSQGTGALNQGNAWSNALSNVGTAVQGGLANQQLLSVLSNLNR